MYDPAGTDTGHADWIELYNASEKSITLKKDDFGIIDEKDLELGKDGKHYLNCHKLKDDMEIPSDGYIVIASSKDNFLSDYPEVDKSVVTSSAFSLSDSGDYLHLSNDSCATIFAEMSYEDSWGGKNNGMTLEKTKLDDNYSKDNWQESYVLGGTPGEPNSEKPKPKEYTAKVALNELLPHPATGQDEYIELYNPDDKDVDLENYILRDASKTGKYVFPDNTKIKAGDYLVVYKKDFKFALNDSGQESVTLFDPNEKVVDEMSYDTSKENYSWNFDGSKWRLSHFLTPGKENEFEKILVGKVEMDEQIYANMYADFEAKSDSDAQKFTWDFGDGHKSYLQKTRHKYTQSGTYAASLKITGNGEDALYNFTVKVEDYDAPNIKIIAINPNPKGSDSKNETITLTNKSKKKVNLLGWSIATGVKNLYNHPIRKDFALKAGTSKILTKKFCAFTLNNTQAKIELRDPTGHVVQKIKYDRRKNKIVEDETFELDNKKWQWSKPPEAATEASTKTKEKKASNITPPSENNSTDENIIAPQSEVEANTGKYTDNPDWQSRRENQIKLLSYNSHVKTPEIILTNQPAVLGTSIEKYSPPEKHWTVSLFDNIWRKINYCFNWVLNNI